MCRYIFLILVMSFPLFLSAQEAQVKGTISSNGKPVELATVAATTNGKTVAGTLTDSSGNFSLTLQPGAYRLEVSRVGYKSFQQEISAPANALAIVLEADAKTLQAVTVQSAKPIIERKLDRIIFNVQGSIMASGGTAWDAVGRAPGVRAAMDGALTVNGKGAVVYMDDRQLRISGEDLKNFLSSLNAENIIRIEVITNPSARYDAQGGAVINIISKKITTAGFNATVNSAYTQATYGSYRGGINFNYRSGKWNLYGNYGYNNSKKAYEETDYVIFQTPNQYSDWQGVKDGWRKNNAHSYKIGLDYNVNKNHIVGFMIDGSSAVRTRSVDVRTDIYNNHSPMVDSFLTTLNDSRSNVNLVALNLNYKGVIDTSNRKTLNIDIDYTPFRNRRAQAVLTNTYSPDGSKLPGVFDVDNNALQDIEITSARIDYSQALNKKWSFETGAKFSSIRNDNDFLHYNAETGSPVLDNTKSNRFVYSEKITASYVNFRGSVGKIALQAGLRGEYTQTAGNSITLQKLTRNDYFKLFPTVYADYSIKKNHDLSIYYGVRISRPDYWRLNPFKYYSSPYSYLEGNPALRPAYIHEVELGYTFKKQYSLNLFYRNKENYFSNITVQDNESKIFYDTQQNLDKSLETGVYLTLPVTAKPWWEMNYFIQASYKKEKSGYLGGQYDYQTAFVYLSATESFILSKKKGWRAEISAWYASPGIQGIYRLGSNYDVSMGVRKTLFKGKGSLQLNVSDIFFSNYYRINVNYANQLNGFKERNDTRAVTLNFSYKFNSGKKIDAARRRNASDVDEKKRAGN